MGIISTDDFNDSLMSKLAMGFCIPEVIVFILWYLANQYFFEWRPLQFGRHVIAHAIKSTKESVTVTILLILWWIFFSLPFLIFIAFGITTAILIEPWILGVNLALVPCALLLILFFCNNNYYSGYKFSLLNKFELGAGIVLLFASALCSAFGQKPRTWMGTGYTILWPPIAVFAFAIFYSRSVLESSTVGEVINLQDRQEQFISSMASKNFDGWVEGGGKLSVIWTIIVIIISLVCNGLFIFLFWGETEQTATIGTSCGSFLVDMIILFSQYTYQSKGRLFTILFASYIVKMTAVTFSSRFWFTGHGFIYLLAVTFALPNTIKGLWKKKKRSDNTQSSGGVDNEIMQSLQEITPDQRNYPISDILTSIVIVVSLSLAIALESFSLRNTEFEALPFEMSQKEAVLGLVALAIALGLAISGIFFLINDQGEWCIYSEILFLVSNVGLLIFSIVWTGFNDIISFKILTFPLFFFVFGGMSILIILKFKHFKPIHTEGNAIANFFKCKLVKDEIIFCVISILQILDFIAIIAVPIVLSDFKFSGACIICAIVGILSFILFCISFANQELNKTAIGCLIGTIVGVVGFCCFLIPWGGWLVAVAIFAVLLTLFCLIFALYWTKLNHWMFEFSQLLLCAIPSFIMLIVSIIGLFAFDSNIFFGIAAFIMSFILFGSLLFFALQRNNWFHSWLSILSLVLLVICSIAIVAFIVIQVKSPFLVCTIICAIIFIICAFGVSGYLTTRSTTDVIVYSNSFIPIRRLFDGTLYPMNAFVLMFFFAFIAAFAWGSFAAVFFSWPWFGCMATSAAIVIFFMLGLSLITLFDEKTLNTLKYIPEDVIKFAIQKAMRITSNSLEMPKLHIKELTYEDFLVQSRQDASMARNSSLFLSALKAQLYISGEVALVTSIEEISTYFASRGVKVDFLDTSANTEERRKIFELRNKIYNDTQNARDEQASYDNFVAQQEAERSRMIMQMMQQQHQQSKQGTFDVLVNNLRSSHQMFADSDFYPSHPVTDENDKRLLSQCEWKYINKEMPNAAMLGSLSAEQIKQGQLGDCYFIAAMASIAPRKWIVEKIFTNPSAFDVGAACVNFYFLGEKVSVPVDLQLPYKNGKPRFARPIADTNPYWFAVVEKAFAKYHGSYNAIDGGNAHAALYHLTGGYPVAIQLSDMDVREKIQSGELFRQLLEWHQSGNFLCAGSQTGSDSNMNTRKIVFGHAYTILRVVSTHGHQLLQLRNTWGDTEWTGDWGDNSPLWTDSMKKELNYVNKDDGIFWMSFRDFVKNYSRVYACIMLDDKQWIPNKICGEWKPGEFDGGTPTVGSADCSHNEQWLIRFKGKTRIRGIFEKAGCEAPAWIYLAKLGGKRMKALYCGDVYRDLTVARNGSIKSFEWEIDNFETPWTLVCCRSKRNQPTMWSLTLRTDREIEITKLDETVPIDRARTGNSIEHV